MRRISIMQECSRQFFCRSTLRREGACWRDRTRLLRKISLVAFVVGLAPADAHASHIIWSNDFDDTPVGRYTIESLHTDWPKAQWSQGIPEGRVNVVGGSEAFKGHSLRITFPKHKDQGCMWRMPLGGSYNEIYWAFRVKLSNNFNPVKSKGGVGGKFVGMCGGSCNTGGKNADGYNGWSTRTHLGGTANHNYSYVADHGPSGKGYFWSDNNKGRGKNGVGRPINYTPGKWHHMETRVVMNTPGKKNGVIQTWLDGNLVLDVRDVLFRHTSSFSADKFVFDNFLSGSGDHSENISVYYDDLIISKTRIGMKPVELSVPRAPRGISIEKQ